MCTNCKVDFPEIEYRIITSKDSANLQSVSAPTAWRQL